MGHTTNEQMAQWTQCGGAGGVCQMFGGRAACTDSQWPGYACHSGAVCARQSVWYYQCVPDGTASSSSGGTTSSSGGGPTSGSGGATSSSSGGTTSSGGSTSSGGGSASLALYEQCGGVVLLRGYAWLHQDVLTDTDQHACFDSPTSGQPPAFQPASCGFVTKPPTQCAHTPFLPAGSGGDCSRFTCADSAFPGTSCASGATCQRASEWYWQCVPGGAASSSGGTASSYSSSSGGSTSGGGSTSSGGSTSGGGSTNGATLALYDQCGGADAGYSQPRFKTDAALFVHALWHCSVPASDQPCAGCIHPSNLTRQEPAATAPASPALTACFPAPPVPLAPRVSARPSGTGSVCLERLACTPLGLARVCLSPGAWIYMLVWF